MLDGPMILRCHLFVPVWYWPVLWVYLGRLEMTAALARAEGRKGFAWHLERNGVIWIPYMDASEAERRARGDLPDGFDRTPWVRLTLAAPVREARFQPACNRPENGTFSEWVRNASGRPCAPARAPP